MESTAKAASGYAGYFSGKVHVTGTLSKAGGSFIIDHPLDPANKYLSHSFVESPDMKNIYDGIAVLDADGRADVELPDWFQALNRDFRYQLTCVGAFAPVYVAEEMHDNRFQIAGGARRSEDLLAGDRHSPGRLCQRPPHRRGREQAGGGSRPLPAPGRARHARVDEHDGGEGFTREAVIVAGTFVDCRDR